MSRTELVVWPVCSTETLARFLVGGLLCLAAQAPHAVVYAQVTQPGPPRLRLGTFEVEPAIAVSTGSNSNLNKEGGGLEVESLESVVIPHLDLQWQRGPNRVFGYLAYEFAMYSGSKTASGTPAIVPTGRNNFSEVIWTREAIFTPTVRYGHWNFGARADDFEEVAQKSRRIEDSYSFGMNLRTGSRISLNGEATLQKTRYDADAVYQDTTLADKLNFDRRIYSAGVGVQLTPLTAVASHVLYFRDHFRRTPERDNDGMTLNGVVTFSPRALITGTALVGIKTFGAPDPGAEAFTGLIVQTTLDYAPRDSTAVTVTLNRDTSYSFDALKSYYVNTDFNVAVEQRLARRLQAFGMFNRYTLDYRGLQKGHDSQVGYGGGLRFLLRPWFKVGFNVDKITREGTSPWTGTRIVGFLTFGTRFRKLERILPGDSYLR